jgi:glycosyltransferase involved in cell wall biosynthesis
LFKNWIDTVLSFDDCICISRVVSEELAGYVREREPEVNYPATLTHFHIGCDFADVQPLKSLPTELSKLESSLASRKSFLMVGTLEPRKNHKMALDALETLWESDVDINLIIIGKEGWNISDFVSRLRCHPENGVRLFWLEDAGDELLETMYKECTCLISASEDEGFGLPLIEAARRGLPILANDISVFREVAGNFATFYKNDIRILASAIEDWLDDFDNGRHIKSDNIPYLTWKESADQLVQTLNLVDRK